MLVLTKTNATSSRANQLDSPTTSAVKHSWPCVTLQIFINGDDVKASMGMGQVITIKLVNELSACSITTTAIPTTSLVKPHSHLLSQAVLKER